MLNKKLMASLLVGAATLVGTALPTPALANNNAALNAMAMQMYMQQQANAQSQAILAQQQSQARYDAAQADIAASINQANYYAPYQVCHPVEHFIGRIGDNIRRNFSGSDSFRNRERERNHQYVAFQQDWRR